MEYCHQCFIRIFISKPRRICSLSGIKYIVKEVNGAYYDYIQTGDFPLELELREYNLSYGNLKNSQNISLSCSDVIQSIQVIPSCIEGNKEFFGIPSEEKLVTLSKNNWCNFRDAIPNGEISISDVDYVRSQTGSINCSELNNWCNSSDVDRDGLVKLNDVDMVRSFIGTDGCHS